MKSNIVSIIAQSGTEPCKVDIAVMHESLLQLPAEKYLELYHMMKNRLDGVVMYSNDDFYCVPSYGVIDFGK